MASSRRGSIGIRLATSEAVFPAPHRQPRARTQGISDRSSQAGRAAFAYPLWVKTYDTLDQEAHDRLRDKIANLADQPLVSVLFPLYNTPIPFL